MKPAAICLGLGLAIVLALASYALRPAAGHEAITGWPYATDCCNGRDCTHAHTGDVIRAPGGWVVTNTGEFIADENPKIRRSQDWMIHVCQRPDPETGALQTLCIYIPLEGES